MFTICIIISAITDTPMSGMHLHINDGIERQTNTPPFSAFSIGALFQAHIQSSKRGNTVQCYVQYYKVILYKTML